MEENSIYETPEQFSLCHRVRERLPDLLDDCLDVMTAEAIRAHLTACYLCAKIYHDMERTIKLVETLPFMEPDRDFTPAIMAAIQRQSENSFQAPVVEVETQTLRISYLPRTITGRQRRLFCSPAALAA